MFNNENTNGYNEDSNQHVNDDNHYNDNIQQDSDNQYSQESNDNENNQDSQYNYYNQYNQDNQYSQNNQQPDNKKRKNNSSLIISVVVAVAAVLFIGVVVTVALVYKDIDSDVLNNIASGNKETTITDNSKEDSKYEDIGSTDISNISSTSTGSVVVTDVSAVVEGAMPSVVAITSTTLVEAGNNYFDSFWDDYFGGSGRGEGSQQYEAEAAGSGIIIDQTDTELLIVTNNHVVEGSDSLKIQFYGDDEESNIDAYTKGTDVNADVAVVAVKLEDIPSETLKNIKKATIGESDDVKVGEGVIAIGNALGYGQSVTTGVISAKDREVNIEDKTMILLQTDAAINGGNSGGALLNAKGEVIGINVAKYSSDGTTSASVEGMGFAIPISSVKDIISTLETRETRMKVSVEEQGYLGIRGNDVPDDASELYGVPKGAYVYSVTKGSAADKAGLVGSDVIKKFDGQIVTSMSDLQNIMQYYKAGETVELTIAYRSGRTYEEKEVTITLDDKDTIDALDANDMQE